MTRAQVRHTVAEVVFIASQPVSAATQRIIYPLQDVSSDLSGAGVNKYKTQVGAPTGAGNETEYILRTVESAPEKTLFLQSNEEI